MIDRPMGGEAAGTRAPGLYHKIRKLPQRRRRKLRSGDGRGRKKPCTPLLKRAPGRKKISWASMLHCPAWFAM